MNLNNKVEEDIINVPKKNIVENNYLLDYKNYYLSRMIKFLINFILTFCFLEIIVIYSDNLTKIQFILSICTFTSILLYILDSNFPTCSVYL
jgi:hypothetical protein